jgi:hypothetical protein
MATIENTTLTPIQGYDPKKRMVFSEPQAGSVPNSTPKIEFKRIMISTKNEDGSLGELIIPTTRLFSFGVSENKSMESGKITGYTFPICMWNRDAPTDKEKEWTNNFNKIVDICIDHLVANREEVELYDLTKGDLTKAKGGLNPLYWRRQPVKDESTGKTILKKVEGQGPTLYTKLIWSKKNEKFLTQFFGVDDQPIEALDLCGKYCFTSAAIKIESIFISGNGKPSLQIKLYEAVVEPSNSGMKRLLARPQSNSKVLSAQNSQTTSSVLNDDNDNDDDGSLNGSDDEKEPVPTTAPVKKVVRKVKKVAS